MIYETSVINPKKQLEFYKDLSEQLQQENEELKKQLEKKYEKVGTFTAEILYEENTKLINQLAEKDSLIKNLSFAVDDLEKYYEKHQKEFIAYLENEIQSCELTCDLIFNHNKEMKIYKIILLKYKEIIGEKDE